MAPKHSGSTSNNNSTTPLFQSGW